MPLNTVPVHSIKVWQEGQVRRRGYKRGASVESLLERVESV